jgi:hypothetical protein
MIRAAIQVFAEAFEDAGEIARYALPPLILLTGTLVFATAIGSGIVLVLGAR